MCKECGECKLKIAKTGTANTASLSTSAVVPGYVVNWEDAKTKKPEDETVVLIAVRDLAEHGVVSAWWCAEDYCWVALDDDRQFDEERVDWYCKMINLPTT